MIKIFGYCLRPLSSGLDDVKEAETLDAAKKIGRAMMKDWAQAHAVLTENGQHLGTLLRSKSGRILFSKPKTIR